VQPTEHFAPIIELSGLGIPDGGVASELGVTISLDITVTAAIINKTREIIKMASAFPSI
jgi:hypothetical protein